MLLQYENRRHPYHLLLQLMLVLVIIGRWLMPKGDLGEHQLSHNLVAYLVSVAFDPLPTLFFCAYSFAGCF